MIDPVVKYAQLIGLQFGLRTRKIRPVIGPSLKSNGEKIWF